MEHCGDSIGDRQKLGLCKILEDLEDYEAAAEKYLEKVREAPLFLQHPQMYLLRWYTGSRVSVSGR